MTIKKAMTCLAFVALAAPAFADDVAEVALPAGAYGIVCIEIPDSTAPFGLTCNVPVTFCKDMGEGSVGQFTTCLTSQNLLPRLSGTTTCAEIDGVTTCRTLGPIDEG